MAERKTNNPRTGNSRLSFELDGIEMHFEKQPIVWLKDMAGGVHLHGYELLYRGNAHPEGWRGIDRALLSHLAATPAGMLQGSNGLPMFVNLDHAYLIEVPDDLLLEAQARHALRFEINEKDVPGEGFAGLCEKINRLSAKGVRFAVDDFGSGRDGLSRVFALDKVECIKVDGALFQAAYRRHHARAALSSMVEHWNTAGILTIAEWIESEALLEFAVETGFAMGQGFYVDELRRREASASAKECAQSMALVMASAVAGEE